MTLQSGLEIPSEKIAEICRRYGIQEMAVCGAAVRDDIKDDSNPMGRVFPGVVHSWEYFRLEEELAEALGRKVDLGTKKYIKPRVKAHILKEARTIYAA